MGATTSQISQLRRMCALATDDATYTAAVLAEYVERYPVDDEDGRDPEDAEWEETYDLNAAAGDVWEEKASAIADLYNFTADGGTFNRSEAFEHARRQASHFRSRRFARSVKVRAARPYNQTPIDDDDSEATDLDPGSGS